MSEIFKRAFCSIKMAFLLVGLYALACGIATFIEKFESTLAAQVYVYNALWFDLLHAWLLLCLIGCFVTSKAWQRKKYASLLLHASFIVMILGAGVTRYFGFEGIIALREGESANFIISSERYIFIQAKAPTSQSISESSQDSEAKTPKAQYLRIPVSIDKSVNKPISSTFDFFGKDLVFKSGALGEKGGYEALKAHISFLGQEREIEILNSGDNAPTKESVSSFEIDGYRFFVAWGADHIPLPFSIRLKKFELERYPGSNSPASYASEVEVLPLEGEGFDFRIYMNHVLDFEGYRFFQSSYFPDESGTILSVNSDPGKIPTYIGYAMLIFGVLWILFDKNGRFNTLGRFLKTQKFLSLMLCVALFLIATPQSLQAKSESSTSNVAHAPTEGFAPKDSKLDSKLDSKTPALQDIPSMISALKGANEVAKSFDSLLVQDFGGRLKPIHTLANDYIHKITKKSSLFGLNPTQVFLGMTFYPEEWQSVQMIATKTPELRKLLGLDERQKNIAYTDVFTKDGSYILQNYLEEANLKSPASRNTFEKDLIEVDERINYAFLIYTGQVLKIFPDSKAENNTWFSPLEAISAAVAQSDMSKAMQLVKIYKHLSLGMQEGIDTSNWQQTLSAIEDIANYQKDQGGTLMLSQTRIDSEIMLDRYNPFHQLTYPYLLLSIVLFILVLVGILKNTPMRILTHRVFYVLLFLLFVLHTAALGLRWYVSDHAPWSNAYESMLYIAWAAILSGVVFFRHSNLALCASSFMAGITLFVAHLGFMDPQIGNLVPVLKSYWLNIHVSVITASYGFLGLCFMLGLISLILFILRDKKRTHIDSSLLSLTALNEMSMIIGLALLTIGNFLGGVWANESWGRYWGWDSKETWALISIGVYAIILHLRFMLKSNLPFVFAAASVVGFFSILMTYFGVNFYLSGMHSYAAGEALPVPLWVKLLSMSIFVLIFIASRHRHLNMPRL